MFHPLTNVFGFFMYLATAPYDIFGPFVIVHAFVKQTVGEYSLFY